jgi:excisionase family DNA binding protein
MHVDAARETPGRPTVADRNGDADSATVIGDELLTVHDAARFLNVSVPWIYEHTRGDSEDRLPFVKLGKYLRFDRTDLRAYIDAKRAESRRQPRRR